MHKNGDLRLLKSLIKQGNKLLKQCQSVRGGNFNDPREFERLGAAWYIQSINFLTNCFGPNSIQVKKFASYFHTYKNTNLVGMYGGITNFVKEDVQKGVGHLEGVYTSLSRGYLKKINPFLSLIYKIWLELKDLLVFLSNVIGSKKQ